MAIVVINCINTQHKTKAQIVVNKKILNIWRTVYQDELMNLLFDSVQ